MSFRVFLTTKDPTHITHLTAPDTHTTGPNITLPNTDYAPKTSQVISVKHFQYSLRMDPKGSETCRSFLLSFKILIYVDFNLLSFIQLSALVCNYKWLTYKNTRWRHEINRFQFVRPIQHLQKKIVSSLLVTCDVCFCVSILWRIRCGCVLSKIVSRDTLNHECCRFLFPWPGHFKYRQISYISGTHI